MIILRFKPAIGGGEEHVYQISKRLVKHGHEIVVYTSDLLRSSPGYAYLRDNTKKSSGITVRRFHAIRLLRDYPLLPTIGAGLMKEKADLIHAHGYGYFPCDISALICRIRKIPLVLTTHGFFPVSTPTNPLLTTIYIKFSRKNLLKMARKIICCSTADSKYYYQLTNPEKISVVPNGIDIDYWKSLPRKGTFCSKYNVDSPIISGVGRIVWAKGFQYLIQAAPTILESVPDATFVIAGEDFGYLTELQELAHKLNVSQSIVFTGRLSNEAIKELYVDSDVVAIPSVYEPFGIIALEAMACGKPVVARRVGGLLGIIKNNVNGLLVGKPDELAEAIVTLLNDRVLAQKMGSVNKAEATEYSWDRIVEELENIYYEVMRQ